MTAAASEITAEHRFADSFPFSRHSLLSRCGDHVVDEPAVGSRHTDVTACLTVNDTFVSYRVCLSARAG